MHRFYLAPSECHGQSLLLTGREAHHAQHVLRLKAGDPATVLDGAGQVILVEVAETKREEVVLRVRERSLVPALPYKIILAQAIPKGRLFEEIIQKATELGTFRITPLITERTVARFDDRAKADKSAKWRTVAIEAIKQCGSPWLPMIDEPKSVKEFATNQSQINLPLVGSLAPGAVHARNWFEQFKAKYGSSPESVSVAIGPEGDFTPEELALLQSAGARPITLGRLVLRTDTAGLYCLSVLNYELSHLASSSPSQSSAA